MHTQPEEIPSPAGYAFRVRIAVQLEAWFEAPWSGLLQSSSIPCEVPAQQTLPLAFSTQAATAVE